MSSKTRERYMEENRELRRTLKNLRALLRYAEDRVWQLEHREAVFRDEWQRRYLDLYDACDCPDKKLKSARLRAKQRRATLAGNQTYAVTFGDRYVKIGRSQDVNARFKTLKSVGGFSAPPDLDHRQATLVRVWPRDIELELHQKYAAHRLVGEVFDLTAQPVRELVFS